MKKSKPAKERQHIRLKKIIGYTLCIFYFVGAIWSMLIQDINIASWMILYGGGIYAGVTYDIHKSSTPTKKSSLKVRKARPDYF